MDLYVYYKVRDGDTAALQGDVLAMQAALAAAHGVRPQLKRRPQAVDGLLTWMEVYPAVTDDFPAVLQAAVDQAGLAARLAGPRHGEIFVDLEPCA